MVSSGRYPSFDRRAYDPGPQRLGKDEAVAGFGARVRDYPVGVDRACNRQAIFGFRVVYRVPAQNHHPRLFRLVSSTPQNLR